MHAIRQYEFGGPEVLRWEESADPVARPGQVRVRVEAAGVHLLDTGIRRGETGGPFPLPELPMTPGREVAGVVDAVGEGVDAGWIGKRAVAHLGQASGGYAQFAVREVDAVHELPEHVDAAQAVAMIGTGRTTLAILEAAPIAPTDVVVVPAAAGGIGALLVQAALTADALVVGLAGGPAKVDQVRALGAQIALDYTEPGWEGRLAEDTADLPPTLVYDTVGGAVGQSLLELLRPGGRFVLAGWSAGQPTQLTTSDIVGRGLTVTAAIGARIFDRPGGLRGLEAAALTALADGRLTPLTTEFPLADAAGAHAALESRATTGKVVLLA